MVPDADNGFFNSCGLFIDIDFLGNARLKCKLYIYSYEYSIKRINCYKTISSPIMMIAGGKS